MTFDTTVTALALALMICLLSVWQVRRKRKPGPPPWIPWHGVLFVSLFIAIGCAAHLPAVWP